MLNSIIKCAEKEWSLFILSDFRPVRKSVDADSDSGALRAGAVSARVQLAGVLGQQDGSRRSLPGAQNEVHRKLDTHTTVLYRSVVYTKCSERKYNLSTQAL